jgi:hypothetical protein
VFSSQLKSLTHHTLKTLSYEPRLYLWVFQFPTEPSVCEERRSISFSFESFIVPTMSFESLYTFMYSLTLSVVHNKSILLVLTFFWGQKNVAGGRGKENKIQNCPEKKN